MTKLERLGGDPPGTYHLTSNGWPTRPPAENAWLWYERRLVGTVRRCYHYREAALAVLIVQTYRTVPSVAALVDELLETLRAETSG